MDELKPSPALLAKIGSLIVHIDEYLSPDVHEYDLVTLKSLLSDPEIVEWLDEMGKAQLIPVKRNRRTNE